MMVDPTTALEDQCLDIDNETPSFDHPWQADAFGLTVQLHKNGYFTWAHWVDVFSNVIKADPLQTGESQNDAYYRQWLTALEQMVRSEGLANADQIAVRAEEWRIAYLNTPHGEPVHLMNATCPPKHRHGHVHPTRQPVAVAPAAAHDL